MSLQPTLSLIMLFDTYVLTTDEWQRIHQAAIKQWPAKTNLISRQEVMRRFALAGLAALRQSGNDSGAIAKAVQPATRPKLPQGPPVAKVTNGANAFFLCVGAAERLEGAAEPQK